MSEADVSKEPGSRGRDVSDPLRPPADPEVRPPDPDEERPIASFDSERKNALPLQVDAPINPEYESSFDEFAGAFRRARSEFLAARGADYGSYREAFDFGFKLAGDHRFADQSWVVAEPAVRREWERDGAHQNWDAFHEAIRAAWEDARGSG